jgi:phospholipid-binding lipoprotein MlaA
LSIARGAIFRIEGVSMAREAFEERRSLELLVRMRTAIAAAVLASVFTFSLTIALPALGGDFDGDEPDPLFDEYFDDEFDDHTFGYPDPLESTNRGVFAFNRQVDKWILDPVTRAYRYVVPQPVRLALSRVFINLGSTKTIVNDFLQLEWVDASVTTSRLVINTTVGIVGLFDVAAKVGLEGHESDFGQTLALAGVPSGPYLVLPVLGPSDVRDGLGTAIDGFFQPTYYIIGPADLLIGPTEILLYSGSSGISTRDRHFLELKALEDSSVDFYAALRSGFYQQRVEEIWGRRSNHRTTEEPGLESGTVSNEMEFEIEN